MKRTLKFGMLVFGLALILASCARTSVPEGQQSPQELAPGPAVGLTLIAKHLTSPVFLTSPPDGSERLFIVDQAGMIRIVTAEGELLEEPFLDLRDRMVSLMPSFDERGLLGLAFHPNYTANGRFFVYYSAPLRVGAPEDFNHTSHISEFRVSATDANQADPDSERILLQVDQPQFNHNAGTLAFGPSDGYLYISLGDGGGANDVGVGHVEDWYEVNDGGNGQDIEENLLGSILRIDVDGGEPYGIPADNPFVGQAGLDEHWAYGFRNPYRFSFDMGGNHDLLAADAGQHLWEEVSIVTKGGNYGWNVKEGTHCFNAAHHEEPLPECPDRVGEDHPREGDSLINPVIEYPNASQEDGLGVVVVGGYVYRGSELPQLFGRYIFGDFSTSFAEPDGLLFMAKARKKGLWKMEELNIATSPNGRLNHYLLGFGQDSAGELYVLTTDHTGPTGVTGRVYKIVGPSGQ